MSTPTAGRRPRRSSVETREHVLDTASRLFYGDGITATGVDRIAREAGVAPTTLYRLFASKDDLVTAYVEHGAAGYRDVVRTVTATGTPRDRILALFDATLTMVQSADCRGCPFLMALAEYPDPRSPVHRAAVAVKQWVREHLRHLVAELDPAPRSPERLAARLTLVLEGVYGTVAAAGTVTEARPLVETLLDVG